MIRFDTIILFSWAIFLAVWGLGAFNVKRDVAGHGGIYGALSRYFLLRLGIGILIVVAAMRVATRVMPGRVPGPHRALFIAPPAMAWIGAVLTACGIGFAIWARVHLGRNWSSRPSMKEDHELVTTGPYRYVRHPIYTGIILATFGTALAGSIFGVAIFVIVGITFSMRVGKEERIMLGLFPAEYAAYRNRTKRLIPFVW